MQINRPKKIFFYVTFSLTGFILLLGSWWLYLTFKLSNELEAMGLKTTNGNIINMVKWEGSVFFILVLCVTLAHLYMYTSDRKKSQSINLFFASLTHELKTPLASIKLQSQVLADILSEIDLKQQDKEKIEKYVSRLHESSSSLEHELDKHLQLSRVERDGILNYKEIEIKSTLQQLIKDFKSISVNINIKEDTYIYADEFAIRIIMRNIIENAQRHNSKDQKVIDVSSHTNKKQTHLIFKNNGDSFSGDLGKLGSLFYKHNSPKGSGLGLYMIKKLMNKMNGKVIFTNECGLITELVFKQNA